MIHFDLGGECACLLDQLGGCLWRVLFHRGQITISNVCNKKTHFLVEKIGVSRNLYHLINKSHWKVSFIRNLLFLVKIAHNENLPTNTCGCAGEDKDHRDLQSYEVNFKYPEQLSGICPQAGCGQRRLIQFLWYSISSLIVNYRTAYLPLLMWCIADVFNFINSSFRSLVISTLNAQLKHCFMRR